MPGPKPNKLDDDLDALLDGRSVELTDELVPLVAAAVPGQAMYPLKLAIEQLRLASVQWSPAREAGQCIRIADERLEELDQLVELRMDAQVPDAVRAVDRAVMAATRAVQEAWMDGADVTKVAGELRAV